MTDTARERSGREGRDRRGRSSRVRGTERRARRADDRTDEDATAEGGRHDAAARQRTRRPDAASDESAGGRRRTAAGAAADSARRARTARDPDRRRPASRPATRRPRRNTEVVVRSGSEDAPGPSRGRFLARRWLAVLVVLGVIGIAYVVMFTSVLGVRSVEVTGVKEIPKDDVIRAAAIEHGTPMVRLDAEAAATRVAALPMVFEVRVERSWPSTVEIIVTERKPVAVLLDGADVHLVDATGLDYTIAKTRPPGLPVLAMSGVRPQDPATHAAVTVLGAIPKQLRAQVTQVSAGTPGDVRLTLSDGRVVKWGNANDNPRKAAVLAPLLTQPGKIYDVASPDFPTITA